MYLDIYTRKEKYQKQIKKKVFIKNLVNTNQFTAFRIGICKINLIAFQIFTHGFYRKVNYIDKAY